MLTLQNQLAQAYERLAVLELKLKPPVFASKEATSEALARVIARQPHEAIFAINEDARHAIDMLLGCYQKAEKSDESFWLALFCREGGDILRRDAENEIAASLDRPSASVLWTAQPKKINELVHNPKMEESGLMGRFDFILSEYEEPELDYEERKIGAEIQGAYNSRIMDLQDFRLRKAVFNSWIGELGF